MPGTDCGPETPLTDSTTQGKRCVLPLPSTYTLVPEVEVKKHLTVPAVTVPCKLDVCHETTGSLSGQDDWLQTVQTTVRRVVRRGRWAKPIKDPLRKNKLHVFVQQRKAHKSTLRAPPPQ